MPELDERLRRLFDSPMPVSLDEVVGRRPTAAPATSRWHLKLVITVFCAILLAGIGLLVATGPAGFTHVTSPSSTTHVTSPSSTSTATAEARVEIRLVLDQTRVTAGTPISGEALLTNTTGKTITVKPCVQGAWLSVGLTNDQVRYSPLSLLMPCSPTVRLSPGLNRFPISISTDFQACTQTSSQATPQLPVCPPEGAPPLPAGLYVTKTVVTGLPEGTRLPSAIPVTLLPVGTVTGFIEPCEGRPIAGAPFAAGTITVYRGQQTYKKIAPGKYQMVLPTTVVARQHVGKNQRFNFNLSPGRYVLVAIYEGPGNARSVLDVQITAGKTLQDNMPNLCK